MRCAGLGADSPLLSFVGDLMPRTAPNKGSHLIYLIGIASQSPHTQVLEMRECGLRAVPSSITALPALHSLLMGYNFMSEVGAAAAAAAAAVAGAAAAAAAGAAAAAVAAAAAAVAAAAAAATAAAAAAWFECCRCRCRGCSASAQAVVVSMCRQCRHAGRELLPGPGLTWTDATRHSGLHPSCLQRPFLPPGPYLANLRVLAMSDAKGFQVRSVVAAQVAMQGHTLPGRASVAESALSVCCRRTTPPAAGASPLPARSNSPSPLLCSRPHLRMTPPGTS